MQIFSDEKGREWAVVLNVTAIRRVRDEAGVDLLDATGEVFQRVAGDPVLLCNVLYTACKPEADAQGITEEAFGEGLAGDALAAATEALLDELVNFTPPDRRALVRKTFDKTQAVQARTVRHVEGILDSDRMDRALERRLKKLDEEVDAELSTLGLSSGSVPESSESPPAPSPSGS